MKIDNLLLCRSVVYIRGYVFVLYSTEAEMLVIFLFLSALPLQPVMMGSCFTSGSEPSVSPQQTNCCTHTGGEGGGGEDLCCPTPPTCYPINVLLFLIHARAPVTFWPMFRVISAPANVAVFMGLRMQSGKRSALNGKINK